MAQRYQAGTSPQHKLKGHCPDGQRCRFTDSPCSQMCSRLQPEAIAAELQARARAVVNRVRMP